MADPTLARLAESLRRLRLTKLQERVETLLQEASQQDLTYAAFLDRCLAEEVASKTDKQVAMHTAMARFPYLKTLEAFDFSFQPSIDKKKIHELATGRFIEQAENVLLTREEASLFFRLLVRRYERASLIVTSNKSFADWAEIFNDQVLATAILDRLLHHATTINIKGDSYRLREKKKAGVLGRKPKPAEPEEVGTPT